MIINLRGTNGSGKTFLARQLIGERAAPIDLLWYDAPTKKEPERKKSLEGWGCAEFIAIGSYKQGCGGMDTIPSFDLQQQAVRVAYDWKRPGAIASLTRRMKPQHVIAEGVLASTVAGSWLNFFSGFNKDEVLIAYLNTPLSVCLERITQRQIAAKGETREIKEDLVEAKIKSINATREKFNKAGFLTCVLDYRDPLNALLNQLKTLGR